MDKQVYESDLVLPPGALVPLHQALADLRADILAAVETLKDGRYAEADIPDHTFNVRFRG